MWRSSAPLLATYTCLCSLIQTNYAFRTDAPGLQPFEWRSETIVTSDLEAMQIRRQQTLVDSRCLCLHCPLSRTVEVGEPTGDFWTFLNLLTNLTQQTPDLKLSLGLLASDTPTYTDLGTNI
ncbi:hypothetical protein WJX79_008452 [Trebouxia sp. C0005]